MTDLLVDRGISRARGVGWVLDCAVLGRFGPGRRECWSGVSLVGADLLGERGRVGSWSSYAGVLWFREGVGSASRVGGALR